MTDRLLTETDISWLKVIAHFLLLFIGFIFRHCFWDKCSRL